MVGGHTKINITVCVEVPRECISFSVAQHGTHELNIKY